MKTLKIFPLVALLFVTPIFGQTFAERATQAYLDTDQNFDLDCYYDYNKLPKLMTPKGETQRTSNHITRDFIIEKGDKTLPMTFTVERNNRAITYRALIDNKHEVTGNLKQRSFFLGPIKDQAFSEEYETTKILCEVNFAYAYPHVLKDGNYHINVHPHKTYDWQNRLTSVMESYLNDDKFESIILLETGNNRGNLVNINHFFDGIPAKLPPNKVDSDLVNVPLEVPIIVSPAGNNRFVFQAENELNVTFTGGNHNYCIWNAARHIVEGMMTSKSEAKVNFYYDTKAIVAQPRGIEGEGLQINFNRRDINRSNLLSDLLSNSNIQKVYHSSYLDYFRHFMARQFSGMYKTYKLNYKAPGFETTVILEGNGTRNVEVSFIYF